jgi:twinkle protein
VPEGAPPPSKDHKPEERSGSDEAGKFKFMWNNRERLQRVRRFVLAVDVMDDPAIVSGDQPLTIVEGEIDKLAVETAGNPFVVSVPEGAPPPSKDHAQEAISSGSDEAGKFKFMWNNRERLQRIKRFVLAVDDDAPGKRLADELIRRLLASRCMTSSTPRSSSQRSAARAKTRTSRANRSHWPQQSQRRA